MESSGWRVAGGLAGLVLCCLLVALAGTAVAVHEAPVGQQSVDADTVSLRVGLEADGSAAWRIAYRVELDDANATDAFESLRADVESDPGPYLDRFGDRMRRTMWSAENATGRDMSIGNLSVNARRESLPQGEYGVLVYRLEWRGFAVAEGDRLRAGDAIDRLFLDERTSLTIAWPEGYAVSSVDPEATTVETDSVTWQGRRDFGPGEPRVVLVRGTPDDASTTVGGRGLPWVGIGLLAAGTLAVGAWAFARRRDGGALGDSGPTDAAAAGDAGSSAEPPPELLSNEEHVLRLLDERGGRMKQQEVAAELDWTDAKTSQVVADLRDAGEVESFRLGRENVLTLPDVSIEPDDEE